MKKKKKERQLLARYDYSDIVDGQVAHLTETLEEHDNLIEGIMNRLDRDDPAHERFFKLFDDGESEKLAEALTVDPAVSKDVDEVLRNDAYEDHGLFQIYFDDELSNLDYEWKSLPGTGFYANENDFKRGYAPDYKNYDKGSGLVRKALEGNRQSEDFEVWLEPDGRITIKSEGYYVYVPLELAEKDKVGKCVIDGDAVLRVKQLSGGYDGYLEFESVRYDPAKRRFTDQVVTVSENHLTTGPKDTVLYKPLRDALRIVRYNTQADHLMGLGVSI